MCFNIIFRKNGKFPETEVSRNENNCASWESNASGELDEGSSEKEGQQELLLHRFL